jgi:hypothetical protein
MSECRLMVAVEDALSLSVMRRVVLASRRNFVISRVFQSRGFGQIKAGIPKFKNASRVLPHVILTDLDQYPCPPVLLEDWGATHLPANMLLRIAVREVEAWLLADREGIADFLGVPANKVPQYPEAEDDPKRCLINLARRSRKRRLASELIPEDGARTPIGPLYNQRLSAFVDDTWDVDRARQSAPSLDRALSRLATFVVCPRHCQPP